MTVACEPGRGVAIPELPIRLLICSAALTAVLGGAQAHAQAVADAPIAATIPTALTGPVSTVPAVAGVEDRARAVQCLATAIAYEAGFEPLEGQQAVAEVVLNRARSAVFQKSVCGVVFAGSERRTGCQFSFTCDGSLRRRLPDRVMLAARAVAEAAIDGQNPARVGGATWYHADYVSPYWAPSLVRVVKIGAHIFYRAPGLGDRVAGGAGFTPAGEPVIAALAATPTAGGIVAAAPAAKPAPRVFAPWGLPIAGVH